MNGPEHVNGEENGAGQVENLVSGSGAESEHSRKCLSRSGAWRGRLWSGSGLNWPLKVHSHLTVHWF